MWRLLVILCFGIAAKTAVATCDPHCASGQCPSSTCLACASGFCLNNGGVCTAATGGLANCATCPGGVCTKCATGVACLNNGACTTLTSQTQNCFKCPGGTTCTECDSPYFLQSGSCVWDSCLAPGDYSTHPCSGHGHCYGGNFCSCNVGWTGFYCNEVDPCYDSASGLECAGHGTCVTTGSGVAEFCSCDPSHIGAQCQTVCNPGTNGLSCSGHGTCNKFNNPPTCTCDSGFTGATCGSCDFGFSGLHCNISECPLCGPAEPSSSSFYFGSCNCHQPAPQAGFCHDQPDFTDGSAYPCDTPTFFAASPFGPCATYCTAAMHVWLTSPISGAYSSKHTGTEEFAAVETTCNNLLPSSVASAGECISLPIGLGDPDLKGPRQTTSTPFLLCNTRGCTGSLCNQCAGSSAFCTITQTGAERLFYFASGSVNSGLFQGTIGGFYQTPIYDTTTQALRGYCRSAPLTEAQFQMTAFFSNGNNIGTWICASGFGGVDCSHPCPNQFCSSGGTCVLIGSTWTCQIPCPTDSSGTPCHGVGTCNGNTGVCTCSAPFNGPACTEQCPENAGQICNGHGTCSQSGSNWICTCNTNWGGNACQFTCPSVNGQICNSLQASGTCQTSSTSATCVCGNQAYGGSDCGSTCPTGLGGHVCSNQGSCVYPTCNCMPGWAGSACDQTCPGGPTCTGHGNCNTATATCTCDNGFGGSDCSQTCPSTTNGLCNGVGVCTTVSNVAVCECDAGWAGSDCTKTCDPQCFTHGFTCHSDTNGQPVCFCGFQNLYIGNDCQYQCPTSDTNLGGCTGLGTCVLLNGTAVCRCDPGFFSPTCRLSCPFTNGGSCNGEGQCVYDPASDSVACHCNPGWSGGACDQECPMDNKNNVCGGNGTCVVDNSGPHCLCKPGTIGPACVQPCPKDSNGAMCSNRGSCDASQNPGVCDCQQGWAGAACDQTCPTSSDEAVCNHRGNCGTVGDPTDLSCHCFDGWTGTACTIPCSTACADPSFVNNGACNCAGIAINYCDCEVAWMPPIQNQAFLPGCPWGLYQLPMDGFPSMQVCCDSPGTDATVANSTNCPTTSIYGAPHPVNCALAPDTATATANGWSGPLCPSALFMQYAQGFTQTVGQPKLTPSISQVQDLCYDNIECFGYTVSITGSVSFFRRRPRFVDYAQDSLIPGPLANYMPYALPPGEDAIHSVTFSTSLFRSVTPLTVSVNVLDRSYGYGFDCPYPKFNWTYYRDNGGIDAQSLLIPYLPAGVASNYTIGTDQLIALAIPGTTIQLQMDIPVMNLRVPLFAPAANMPFDGAVFTCDFGGLNALYVAYNPGNLVIPSSSHGGLQPSQIGMSNVLVGWTTVPPGTQAIRFVVLAKLAGMTTVDTACAIIGHNSNPRNQPNIDQIGMLAYATYLHWGGSQNEAKQNNVTDEATLARFGYGMRHRLNSDPACLYTFHRLYSPTPTNNCGPLDGLAPFPDDPSATVNSINANALAGNNILNARAGSRPCNGRGVSDLSVMPGRCLCDRNYTVDMKMNEFGNDTLIGTRGTIDYGCGFASFPCQDPSDNITEVCFLNRGACVLNWQAGDEVRFAACTCGSFPCDPNRSPSGTCNPTKPSPGAVTCNTYPRTCESTRINGQPLNWTFNEWQVGTLGSAGADTCREPRDQCRRDPAHGGGFHRPFDLSFNPLTDSYGCELPPDNIDATDDTRLQFPFGDCTQVTLGDLNSFTCNAQPSCGGTRWGPYCEMVPVQGGCLTPGTALNWCMISPQSDYWGDGTNRQKYIECGEQASFSESNPPPPECNIPCVGCMCCDSHGTPHGQCVSHVNFPQANGVPAPDEFQQFCQCDPNWVGPLCQTNVCQPACIHGSCIFPGTGAPPFCQCDTDANGNLVWGSGGNCSVPHFNSGGLLHIAHVQKVGSFWTATCVPGWLTFGTHQWCTQQNCFPDPTCGGFQSVAVSSNGIGIGCNTDVSPAVCNCADIATFNGGTGSAPQLKAVNGTCVDRCGYYSVPSRGFWDGTKCVCNSAVGATGSDCRQTYCGIYGRTIMVNGIVQCDCYLDPNRDPTNFCKTCLPHAFYEPLTTTFPFVVNTTAKCIPCQCNGEQTDCTTIAPGFCTCQRGWANPSNYAQLFGTRNQVAGCTQCSTASPGFFGPTCTACPATCPNGGTCQTGKTGTGCPTGTTTTSSSGTHGTSTGSGSTSGGSSGGHVSSSSGSGRASSTGGGVHTSTGTTHAGSSSTGGHSTSGHQSTGVAHSSSSGSHSSNGTTTSSSSSNSNSFWQPWVIGVIVAAGVIFIVGIVLLSLWLAGLFPPSAASEVKYTPVRRNSGESLPDTVATAASINLNLSLQ